LTYLKNEKLRASIEAAEAGPTPAELDAAPYMNFWRLEHRGEDELRLHGRCDDHPEIDDRRVITSPLLALDHKHGWARTYTRWYRVGPNIDIVKTADWNERLAEVEDKFRCIRNRLRKGLQSTG